MFSQMVNFNELVLPPGNALPPLSIEVQGVLLNEGRKTFVIDTVLNALINAGSDECTAEDTSEFDFGFVEDGGPTPAPAPTPSGVTLPPTPGTAPDDTIEAIIQTLPELSTLVSVLTNTGLLSALGEPGPLTLFAPTDAAFTALNLPPDTPAEVVTNVLLYHVVGGEIDLAVGSVPYTALNGDELVVTVSELGNTVNSANIDETIPASNGVIYIIDAVLLPPTDASPTPAPGPAECTLTFLELNCVNGSEGQDCSEGYGRSQWHAHDSLDGIQHSQCRWW